MERNKNVDIIRTLAIFLIMLNHFWGIISNVQYTNIGILNFLFSMGGELGVTLFFIMSGYGIYASLYKTEKKGKISYKSYLIKRINRIIPPYYISILIMLLLTDGTYYLSKEQLGNVLSHIFLIHNVFPSYAGGLNGVLWALGTIFQFYLVAVILYKGINRYKSLFLVISVCFTIICKMLAVHYLLPIMGMDMTYSFWAGRNLLTSVLDNFVIGMFISYLYYNRKTQISNICAIILSLVSLVLIYVVCKIGITYGIHTDNISGYVIHSMIALAVGLFIFAFSYVKIGGDYISKLLIWISHYEYSIYIWHYLLAANIVEKSGFVQNLLQKNHVILTYVLVYIIVIAWGFLYTKMTNYIKFIDENAFKKVE